MLGQSDLDSEAMSACTKVREEATSVVSSDRISSLPPEIKGDILSRLNVEEAVRTSILSSTWKDAWTNMPKIILCVGNFEQTKFVTLVDMVLSLHKGTIEKFDISGKGSYHDEFARWMLMLSRRSPRSVIIKLNSEPELKNIYMQSYRWRVSRLGQDQASIQELTIQMDHLITASMYCFEGLDYEIDFVAKLLSLAPALEEVKIEWCGQSDRSEVLAKLRDLPRASPRAKVIVTF